MRILGPVLTLLATLASTSAAQQGPRIIVIGMESRLDLPAAIWDAIRQVDSTFVPYTEADFLPFMRHQLPTDSSTLYAVLGDVNADQHLDLMVYGQGRRDARLLGVVSSGNGYRAYELVRSPAVDPRRQAYHMGPEHYEYGLARSLVRFPPGRIVTAMVPDTLDLRTPAAQLRLAEVGGVLYYWHQGAFRSFDLGD
jgi:hypothetical protein